MTNTKQSSSEELRKTVIECCGEYVLLRHGALLPELQSLFASHLQSYTEEIRREMITFEDLPKPVQYIPLEALDRISTKWGVDKDE